jgi:hypothetical protein
MRAESMNRLGHLVADADGPADAADLARLLAALTGRRARMRKVAVHVEETGPACPAGDPQGLLCGLAAVLDACYTGLPPESEVRLALAREGECGIFRVRCQPGAPRPWTGLDAACPGLPAGVTLQPDAKAGEWRLGFCAADA